MGKGLTCNNSVNNMGFRIQRAIPFFLLVAKVTFDCASAQAYAGAQSFGNGQAYGGGQSFGSGQNFGNAQAYGGVQSFSKGQNFGNGQNFNNAQSNSGAQSYASSQSNSGAQKSSSSNAQGSKFAGAQSFGNGQAYGGDQSFGNGQAYGGVQSFVNGQNFNNAQSNSGAQSYANSQSNSGTQSSSFSNAQGSNFAGSQGTNYAGAPGARPNNGPGSDQTSGINKSISQVPNGGGWDFDKVIIDGLGLDTLKDIFKSASLSALDAFKKKWEAKALKLITILNSPASADRVQNSSDNMKAAGFNWNKWFPLALQDYVLVRASDLTLDSWECWGITAVELFEAFVDAWKTGDLSCVLTVVEPAVKGWMAGAAQKIGPLTKMM